MKVFEENLNRRNTQSVKWDAMEHIFDVPDASEILPMWVADMDFPVPEAVTKALQDRLQHPIYGYTFTSDSAKKALVDWLESNHQWNISQDEILFHHGVIPAMSVIIQSFTKVSDNILILPPVYPPFKMIPEKLGRNVIESTLREQNGNYEINWHDFEEKLKQDVKLYIHCHPHNPVGKVWTEQELRKIVELCEKYNVRILSDEIHADLVLFGNKHLPLAKIAPSYKEFIYTCVAPTKTFNLAGIQIASMIVANEKDRETLKDVSLSHGFIEVNAFAGVALEAAYSTGKEWLEEAKKVIESNIEYVIQTLPNEINGLEIARPQGTYLLWIDYRKTGLEEQDIINALLQEGKVALEAGSKYGEEGKGFLRMNVATSPSLLKDGVARTIKAFKHLQ
ncbi:MalY/PatB family protein [Paenisporosarcina cavernae]|uniref:cysteine-S-conjugate beta-lyase n=1 Tax=Paenisporosarcina cavernae TaxID=2320858 RepID=A0A385YUG3_9BACL|nr:MalY/PatB family protein [Paenisporosarcina cavernae]AYC29940.1 pyridoxal phosphate-dependent aminotransferase [Paenisporosarcina cavernae]